MNIEIARDLLCHAGELTQFVSQFQARYGRGCQVTPGRDPESWRLYEAINTIQLRLALLLDEEALENAHPLTGLWWETQDVPNVAAVQSLVSQIGHLITACAYADFHDSKTAINATQRAIAGFLNPSIRLIAQDRQSKQIAS